MTVKAKKTLNIFDKIVFTINVIFTVALLLSYLAPGTDPRDFLIIAILGFGYQVLFLLNILLIIYWLIRLRIYFLISTLGILAGFTILTANFSFHLPNANNKASTGDIRMMAYNVNGFKGIDTLAGKPIQDQILQLIKNKRPDVINIEEYVSNKKDSGAIGNSLKNVLKSNYYYFNPFAISRKDSSGNAIFTKFPIINYGAIPAPEFLNLKAIFVDVKYKNKIFRVYCVHLAPVDVGKEKSSYLNGKIDLSRSFYIESRLSLAFVIRSHQVAIIKRHLERCPYPYIIAGDFNDTPISFAVNELSEGLKNTFIEKGSGPGITYYSAFPKLHIDYIFVSPQFDVLNYQTVDKKLSDHKPIFSDLKLN